MADHHLLIPPLRSSHLTLFRRAPPHPPAHTTYMSIPLPPASPPESAPPKRPRRSVARVLADHARFVGPGILAAVAYFDPGNWSTDLAAGSEFGYSLLFVVLMAGLGAILFQILACRLGVVTGKDLAAHLRTHLHPVRWMRWTLLYPLYVLSEIAIIATDIAELLGTAIALNLLFPVLPLYAGVLLTAADVLLILLTYSQHGGSRSQRVFELLIAAMTLGVFISFFILTLRVHPSWPKVFRGYLPSHDVVKPSAIYTSVGIIGATLMPHSLFLGSRLSTIDRLTPSSSTTISTAPSRCTSPSPPKPTRSTSSALLPKLLASLPALYASSPPIPAPERDGRQSVADDDLPIAIGAHGTLEERFEAVQKHLAHGSWDIGLSLIMIAVPVNSSILIVAAATYYYGRGNPGGAGIADLFDAHALIRNYVGEASAFLFAFALLCAGQSASITATLAGQVVSEGFLAWRVSPFLRRLLTRLLGIVPALALAIGVGRRGLDDLLNASQVVLSIVLPFVVAPLLWLVSRKETMRIWKPLPSSLSPCPTLSPALSPSPSPSLSPVSPAPPGGEAEGEWVDLTLSWPFACLGWAVFIVLCAANAYVILELGLGNDG